MHPSKKLKTSPKAFVYQPPKEVQEAQSIIVVPHDEEEDHDDTMQNAQSFFSNMKKEENKPVDPYKESRALAFGPRQMKMVEDLIADNQSPETVKHRILCDKQRCWMYRTLKNAQEHCPTNLGKLEFSGNSHFFADKNEHVYGACIKFVHPK